VTALNQNWANAPALFLQARLPDGCLTFERVTESGTAFGLEDEQGRLNVNKARPEMLQRLLGEGNDELVQSILLWRTPASEPAGLERENDFYEARPHPYRCKLAPFESVEELLMVRGMTPGLFNRLRPHVTVYTNGLVNLNTASRPVLLALGFDETFAERLIGYRKGADGQEGTEDDGLFKTVDGVLDALSEAGPLMGDEAALLTALKPALCVRSTVFRARLRLSAGCGEGGDGTFAQAVLSATGLSGQWIIKYYSDL
jgi:type II secretory pathway component PulK